jgi:hypothetical protein
MTSHAELSRDLALALGYYPESVQVFRADTMGRKCQVFRVDYPIYPLGHWRKFDFRDPSVAMPLLVWLMTRFNTQLDHHASGWFFRVYNYCVTGDTLEEAICRAVIAVRGK